MTRCGVVLSVLLLLCHSIAFVSCESGKTTITATTADTNNNSPMATNDKISSKNTVISDSNNNNPEREPKLLAQFARAKDPSSQCLPSDPNSKEGPDIFVNVDCSENGARWDYSYQVT